MTNNNDDNNMLATDNSTTRAEAILNLKMAAASVQAVETSVTQMIIFNQGITSLLTFPHNASSILMSTYKCIRRKRKIIKQMK